jgi:glycosyltransferase involved in cell wall biosynthesis
MIFDKSQLNVWILTSEYPPEMVGGLGTHVFELAKGLGRLGCHVEVFAPSKFGRTLHDGPDVTVHFFSNDTDPSASAFPADIQWFIDLNKNFIRHASKLAVSQGTQPDVIHCHDWLNFPAAYQLGKLLKCPVISTVHLLQNPIVKWWGDSPRPEIVKQERDLCLKSDAVITVSRSMRQIISKTHGIPAERIQVVYNGIDTQHFTKGQLSASEKDELRRSFAMPEERIFIYAGRLTPQKGIPALFEAAVKVLSARPDVHYLIAGAPDFTGELWDADKIQREAKAMFTTFQFWDRMHMLGKVSRERVAALYQISDVALVPSLYEPFGYAATEAMAAGLPVIASAVGGLAEIIQDGKSGLLVPVTEMPDGWNQVDVEKLSAAQIRLLDDRELAGQLGRAGRQRVVSEFHSDKMAEPTLAIYYQCIQSARNRPAITEPDQSAVSASV